SHCFKLYDVVRIDHFRGFDEYYSIPYGDENAKNGHWEKGPGMELFTAVEKALGKREVIAEDLGFMTDSVRQLVKDSGFPNMKVLEFAFDNRDTGSRNDYLPHNYNENCVAYTGTHDNQTIASWFDTITEDEREMAREYLCDGFTPTEKLNKAFISLIMRSKARLCIIPMQDWLGLDDKSRINVPSTVGKNWRWRLTENQLTEKLKNEILKTTRIFGRV
ncbi:MAG: 4-alpha-glucanotransferase, partial [Lachnospiraceae bacterium]|nr:4-alpha-glucanotransferase [Lachnospiraceae bacterium]